MRMPKELRNGYKEKLWAWVKEGVCVESYVREVAKALNKCTPHLIMEDTTKYDEKLEVKLNAFYGPIDPEGRSPLYPGQWVKGAVAHNAYSALKILIHSNPRFAFDSTGLNIPRVSTLHTLDTNGCTTFFESYNGVVCGVFIALWEKFVKEPSPYMTYLVQVAMNRVTQMEVPLNITSNTGPAKIVVNPNTNEIGFQIESTRYDFNGRPLLQGYNFTDQITF